MPPFAAQGYADRWLRRLVGPEVVVDVVASAAPGGSQDNSAHVHCEDDLHVCTIEYDPDRDTGDLRVAILHEIVHVAFRHVGAIIGRIGTVESAWLRQALEEDTESLALALFAMDHPSADEATADSWPATHA